MGDRRSRAARPAALVLRRQDDRRDRARGDARRQADRRHGVRRLRAARHDDAPAALARERRRPGARRGRERRCGRARARRADRCRDPARAAYVLASVRRACGAASHAVFRSQDFRGCRRRRDARPVHPRYRYGEHHARLGDGRITPLAGGARACGGASNVGRRAHDDGRLDVRATISLGPWIGDRNPRLRLLFRSRRAHRLRARARGRPYAGGRRTRCSRAARRPSSPLPSTTACRS